MYRWRYLFFSTTRARLSTSRESLTCHGFNSIKSRINNTLCCPGTCANTSMIRIKYRPDNKGNHMAHKHRLCTNSTFLSYHCNHLESSCWHRKPETNSKPSNNCYAKGVGGPKKFAQLPSGSDHQPLDILFLMCMFIYITSCTYQ